MKGFKTGKNRKNNRTARVLLGFAAVVGFIVLGKVPAFAGTAEDPENISAAVEATGAANPANPVHHCTKDTDSTGNTDTTTWSYVYFGSYPQSEVTGSVLTSAITGAAYDENGDAWVNGTKYRRISKSDTNYNGYFGDSTYRYFKWERIKWRVLKNDGNTLFVMADKGLDCKDYHDPGGSVTWENCTLRNWLNNGFYRTAFNSREQNAVVQKNVVNADNPEYGTAGGNNTTDKVFLLSISEAQNTDYGFCEDYTTCSVSRRVKASDYAHARGAYVSTDTAYAGNCWWWLRSPGLYANNAANVLSYGHVHRSGGNVYSNDDACVPALHINLSSDLWSTVDDGTSGSGGSLGNTAPTVSSPKSMTVKAGTSATFSVTASGGNPSNYTYKWYYSSSQSETRTRIGGATSSSYTITSGNMTSDLNGRYYYCIVSNGQYDVESSRAKLTVYSAPIVTAPSSQIVKVGNSATFSVTASNGYPSAYAYQWYYASSSKGTGTRISGATSSSYAITSSNMTENLNGRYYYCIVSNGQYDVESDRAKLIVTGSGDSSSSDIPENPIHHCTGKDDGSDYTNWSYVYFGSYPQSEVTGSALTSAVTGASYDTNGDAWVNGTKYRRISKSDTNHNEYFGDSTYRYFRWERIKWRVLKNDGSTLFVMADKCLDCKDYHDTGGSVTWENCTLRSWLNSDFYRTAFNSKEQNVVVQQNILNEDNPNYGTEGGNNTTDKVFLLSISEAQNTDYGFCGIYSTSSVSRRVKASDYAHIRGVYVDTRIGYAENCWWFLRSPGRYTSSAAYVISIGSVSSYGDGVDGSNDACVPALYINLSSSLWSTVDDGTSGPGGIIPSAPTVTIPSDRSIKAGNSATFSVTASGGNPSNYTYQWYYASSQSGAGTAISGATSSSYTITSSNMTSSLNGRYYYCVVSNGVYDVTSSRAKLTVYSAPSVTATSDRSVKAGTSAIFSVTASGGNPSNYTYQWYYATSQNGAGTRISGATSSSYTITSSNMTESLNGRYYYCIVSNGQYDVTSSRAKLTVQSDSGQNPSNPSSPPTVSGLEEWYSVAEGMSLSLAVTASGGNPTSYTYQWYYALSETGTRTRISGATSSGYTIPSSEMTMSIHGRYYFCVVSNGAYSVESRRTRVLVHKEPDGSQNGGNQNTGAGSHTANGTRPQNINAVSRTVAYSKKVFPLGASTDGDGVLTYQSSNPKVAAVLPDGRVKMKNYGTTVITISASQTASCAAAVKQVTVEVVPKKGALKKAASPYSRWLKLAWKKDKKAKGYEVQISPDKLFRSNTYKRTYPKGKTSATLIGLQSKKKYYVRVRLYAKAGKKKVYGEWSKVRTVNVR